LACLVGILGGGIIQNGGGLGGLCLALYQKGGGVHKTP